MRSDGSVGTASCRIATSSGKVRASSILARRMCQSLVTSRMEVNLRSASHSAVSVAFPRVSTAAEPSVMQHSIRRVGTLNWRANSSPVTSGSTPVTSIALTLP